MRFYSWLLLLLISSFLSISLRATENSTQHRDNGKLLEFDATNFDAGTLYIGDEISPYFSFVNITHHNVRIREVKANNGWYKDPFRLVEIDTNHIIKPGQRDTIFFERYFSSYSPKLGNYDLSFTVKFMDSEVQQHINIFCFLRENKGEVVMDTITLSKVNLGELVTFSSTVTNTGSDIITLWEPDNLGFTNYLDQYPIKIAPKESRTLEFEVNTSSFPNRYDKKVYVKTNVNENHVISIPIKGEVIAPNRPDIYFESKILRLDLMQGGPAIYHFWYTNTGDMPLIISMCKGSCGCIVPNCSREPLAPGDSAEVVVKYDSNRIGPINKSVTVTSNAVTPRIVLRVTGSISRKPTGGVRPTEIHKHEPKLKFKRKQAFINYHYNERKVAIFNFTNEGEKAVKIHIPTYPGATVLRLSDDVILPGQSGWIAAEYDSKRVGPFTRNITLGIDGVYYKDFLELSGVVREEHDTLIPIGPQIYFEIDSIYRELEYGGDGRYEFKYTNTGDEDLQITLLRPSGSMDASCDKEPIKPGEIGVIFVRYDTRRPGLFRKTILVDHNAGNGKTYLKYQGVVSKKPDAMTVSPLVRSINSDTLSKKKNNTVPPIGPRIKFETTDIVRHYEYGADGNDEIVFTNTGDAPLIISQIKPSGSINIDFPRTPIMPGEKGVIHARYNTELIGPHHSRITVIHNGQEGITVLKFKISLGKKPKESTTLTEGKSDINKEAALQFNTLIIEQNFKMSEEVFAEFTCLNYSNTSVDITKVINDDGGHAVFFNGSIDPGQKRTIRVTYPANKIGPFNHTIVIYHTDSSKPIILKFKGVIF